jgi:putative transposase
MQDVCADFGAELREFNGEPEHVNMLVHSLPTVAISPPGQQTQRRVLPSFAAEVPRPAPTLLAHQVAVVGSYFAESAPFSVLRQYIEQPNRPS